MLKLNTRWTIADMDRIARLVNEGWRPDDIAHEYGESHSSIIALLMRNGLPVLPRRKRK